MKIGRQEFNLKGHTYIMGILNVTPDSFSDGGSYKTLDDALKRVDTMIKEGADIIDIGGESTRPGYTLLTDETEISRICPVIEAVRKNFDIPISADTYKSQVAAAALKSGADVINDIWGLKYDEKLAGVIADSDAVCCLMHNRKSADYENFIPDCLSDIKETLYLAESAGIKKDRIIIDPGVGFGKTLEHNLLVMKHLKDFHTFGLPLLLGTSRKSMIGKTLDVPVEQRLEGTLVTTVMAAMAGVHFIRVHDILSNKRAIMMAEAILNIED